MVAVKDWSGRTVGLTEAQERWLAKAVTNRRYSFLSDAVGWREIGRPLKDLRLLEWVPNPRETAVVLTKFGQQVRDRITAPAER